MQKTRKNNEKLLEIPEKKEDLGKTIREGLIAQTKNNIKEILDNMKACPNPGGAHYKSLELDLRLEEHFLKDLHIK